MHVARGDKRQPACLSQLAQRSQPCTVVRPLQQLGRSRGTAGKALGHRARMLSPLPLGERAGVRKSQQNEPAGQPAVQIAPAERIAAFLRPAPAAGDELGQIAVASAVGGEQHQPRAVLQPYLRADDQRQADVFRRDMRPHGSGEQALVGERERPVPEPRGALHQLFRMRSAAKESEVGKAVQLGVGGEGGIHGLRRKRPADTIRPPRAARDTSQRATRSSRGQRSRRAGRLPPPPPPAPAPRSRANRSRKSSVKCSTSREGATRPIAISVGALSRCPSLKTKRCTPPERAARNPASWTISRLAAKSSASAWVTSAGSESAATNRAGRTKKFRGSGSRPSARSSSASGPCPKRRATPSRGSARSSPSVRTPIASNTASVSSPQRRTSRGRAASAGSSSALSPMNFCLSTKASQKAARDVAAPARTALQPISLSPRRRRSRSDSRPPKSFRLPETS